MADAVVSISADLTALKRSLADLPNLSGEAAQKTLINVEKVVRKAEASAKAAAKASSKAFGDTQKRAQSAADSIGDLGGKIASFGGMLSLPGLEGAAPAVTALGDSIELLANPLGIAVGALAAWGAAVAGLVVGSVSLVASSDELLARLDEIGRADVISAEQTEQLATARDGMEAIKDIGTEMAVVLAADVAPAIQTATELLVGIGIEGRKALQVVTEHVDLLSVGLDILTGGAVGQARLAMDAFGVSTSDVGVAIGGLVEDVRAQGAEYIAVTSAARELSKAEDDIDRPRHAAAARDQAAAEREVADALRELGRIQAANAESVGGIEAQFAEVDAINALAAAHRNNADVQGEAYNALSALAANNERQAQEIYEAELERANELANNRQAAVDQIQGFAGEVTTMSEGMVEDLKEMQVAAIAAAAGYLDDSFGQLAGGVADLTAAMAESGKLSEQAAMKAYRVSKAAGLAQVAISTAVAITKALAELGPVLGPIAGIGLAASGAAQAAAIAATPPPSFFVGGSAMRQPDATVSVLHRGETVQTAASVRRDDRGAARASNSGRSAPAPIQVQFLAGGRVVDEVMQQESARPGSGLRKAIGTPRYGQRTR